MRLTISSTAMMKPLLQSNKNHHSIQPPLRVLGLIERQNKSPEQHQAWRKVVQYFRPDLHQACLHTAQWGHFLTVKNSVNENCVAVFGYKFDGVNCWYHVWNSQTARSYWLRHQDDMDYQPYAITAMDALVSLMPHWNGELHAAPCMTDKPIDMANQSMGDKSNKTVQSATSSCQANSTYTLQVSDASADANGGLWFLVTVKSAANDADTSDAATSEANTREQLTGWISPKSMQHTQ